MRCPPRYSGEGGPASLTCLASPSPLTRRTRHADPIIACQRPCHCRCLPTVPPPPLPLPLPRRPRQRSPPQRPSHGSFLLSQNDRRALTRANTLPSPALPATQAEGAPAVAVPVPLPAAPSWQWERKRQRRQPADRHGRHRNWQPHPPCQHHHRLSSCAHARSSSLRRHQAFPSSSRLMTSAQQLLTCPAACTPGCSARLAAQARARVTRRRAGR